MGVSLVAVATMCAAAIGIVFRLVRDGWRNYWFTSGGAIDIFEGFKDFLRRGGLSNLQQTAILKMVTEGRYAPFIAYVGGLALFAEYAIRCGLEQGAFAYSGIPLRTQDREAVAEIVSGGHGASLVEYLHRLCSTASIEEVMAGPEIIPVAHSSGSNLRKSILIGGGLAALLLLISGAKFHRQRFSGEAVYSSQRATPEVSSIRSFSMPPAEGLTSLGEPSVGTNTHSADGQGFSNLQGVQPSIQKRVTHSVTIPVSKATPSVSADEKRHSDLRTVERGFLKSVVRPTHAPSPENSSSGSLQGSARWRLSPPTEPDKDRRSNASENAMRGSPLAVTAISALLATANCGDSTSTKPASATVSVSAPVTALRPVKIAVLIDKTGSMGEARTPDPQPADFGQLEELLQKTGGEISVGIIRDNSNRPLLRLRLDVPPLPPASPSKEQNVFAEQDSLEAYRNRLALYKGQLTQLHSEAEEKVGIFSRGLEALIDQKADAPNTDLYGAVQRAELFLNESDITWPRPTRRYLVVVSDGMDNVRKEPIVVRSGAKVVVINGSGSLGALAHLKPEPFESLESAFRFVAGDAVAPAAAQTGGTEP